MRWWEKAWLTRAQVDFAGIPTASEMTFAATSNSKQASKCIPQIVDFPKEFPSACITIYVDDVNGWTPTFEFPQMFVVKNAIQTSFLKSAPNKVFLCICVVGGSRAYKIEISTRNPEEFFPHPIFYRMWDMQKRISLNVSWCFVMCIFLPQKKRDSRVLLEGLIVLNKTTPMEKRNHISFPFVTRMHKKPKFHYLYRKAVKVVNHLEQWTHL